jgi:hypothetical protein
MINKMTEEQCMYMHHSVDGIDEGGGDVGSNTNTITMDENIHYDKEV